jgi:hypothetical protein
MDHFLQDWGFAIFVLIFGGALGLLVFLVHKLGELEEKAYWAEQDKKNSSGRV